MQHKCCMFIFVIIIIIIIIIITITCLKCVYYLLLPLKCLKSDLLWIILHWCLSRPTKRSCGPTVTHYFTSKHSKYLDMHQHTDRCSSTGDSDLPGTSSDECEPLAKHDWAIQVDIRIYISADWERIHIRTPINAFHRLLP